MKNKNQVTDTNVREMMSAEQWYQSNYEKYFEGMNLKIPKMLQDYARYVMRYNGREAQISDASKEDLLSDRKIYSYLNKLEYAGGWNTDELIKAIRQHAIDYNGFMQRLVRKQQGKT